MGSIAERVYVSNAVLMLVPVGVELAHQDLPLLLDSVDMAAVVRVRLGEVDRVLLFLVLCTACGGVVLAREAEVSGAPLVASDPTSGLRVSVILLSIRLCDLVGPLVCDEVF